MWIPNSEASLQDPGGGGHGIPAAEDQCISSSCYCGHSKHMEGFEHHSRDSHSKAPNILLWSHTFQNPFGDLECATIGFLLAEMFPLSPNKYLLNMSAVNLIGGEH